MTVERLQHEITSREFSEWIAYDRIQPIGDDRGDVQAGVIASTLANINRDPKKPPYDIEDFMPFGEKRIKKTDWRVMRARLKAMTSKATIGDRKRGKRG